MITFYTKRVDDGFGRHNLRVEDGIIVRQWLEASSGDYTGDGNPSLVGQPVSVLEGTDFTQVDAPRVWDSRKQDWVGVTYEHDEGDSIAQLF